MGVDRPAIFTDATGAKWHIAIKYGDICRVKKYVTGADNNPLDLCIIAESGDYRQVRDHIDVIVKCVYWLLHNDIKELSGKTGTDAQEWFYNRLDGATISSMTKAWYEAIVNFTPYPVVRSAMMTAGDGMTRAELVEAIEILAGQLEGYMSTPALSGSTLTTTAMESL